jgi:hypothetical protein
MPEKYKGADEQGAQTAQTAETQLLAVADAAIKHFGGGLFNKPEVEILKRRMIYLQSRPQDEWNQIIDDDSRRGFFNPTPEKIDAAKKILRSAVSEASITFRAADKNGLPSKTETELRLPNWTYAEGKVKKLQEHLQDGMTLQDALNAKDVNIPDNHVKIYRIYPNQRRSTAQSLYSMPNMGDAVVPVARHKMGGVRSEKGDVGIDKNKPIYQD